MTPGVCQFIQVFHQVGERYDAQPASPLAAELTTR